tara:strand:- start:32747 stop:34132 length:1386 start_codon:yes stop_codon:yes gene_type:complete
MATPYTTPTELTPTASKSVTAGSYIDFENLDNAWAQQYLPELYEQEVERYGDRTISGFLRLVGAEMPMESDQVIWEEQGRLHLSYTGATMAANSGGTNVVTTTAAHAVRVNQTVVITDNAAIAFRALVTAVSSTTLTLDSYTDAIGLGTTGGGDGLVEGSAQIKFFVFGSEFGKGTDGMQESIAPDVHVFSNKPIILKDNFEVNGSDIAQIGWIDAETENGTSGYLWYLKAQGDTKTRFADYCEMACLESVSATNAGLGVDGTQGMFDAISSRGIVASSAFDVAADVIEDFDFLVKELDKQGSIEENMMYIQRDMSIAIDSGLATANSYGTGGTSYGVFNNDADMALNLGFTGVRRGSYDFYKSDWKYLNNFSTRGTFTDVQGVVVPAGTTTVYDQTMGKNVRRPFLHVRYRANAQTNRKMKSWITGAEAGNSTVDEMRVSFLDERCLVTQAANNFVLFNA